MGRILLWTMSAIVTLLATTAFADDSGHTRVNIYELRIKGCSSVIGRNPNDAVAYYARGLAYQFAGMSIEASQITTKPLSSTRTRLSLRRPRPRLRQIALHQAVRPDC